MSEGKKKKAKKVLRVIISIFVVTLITAILLELVCWAYVSARFEIGYKDLVPIKQDHIDNLPADNMQLQRESLFWNKIRRYQLHPYFGFINEPKCFPNINNMGVATRGGTTYPYRADKDEFVVGIFGGSVALQMFRYMSRNDFVESKLLPLLKEKGYNRLSIINFAEGGYKQPQSLFAFQYFVDTIDMAIFIEGYNEVKLFDYTEHVGDYPHDFPHWNVWKPLSEKKFTPYLIQMIARLEMNKSRQVEISQYVVSSILKRSMFVHLVWNAYINALGKEENQLREKIMNENRDNTKMTDLFPKGFKYEDRRDFFFKKYENYVRMAHVIGQAYSIPCFFVIQPNHHLKDSKPLSEEERKRFVRKDLLDIINRLYPPLVEMYKHLSQKGIAAINLTMVFRKTHESAYKDNSTHLNPLGLKIFTEGIVKEILKRRDFLSIIPDAQNRQGNRLFKEK